MIEPPPNILRKRARSAKQAGGRTHTHERGGESLNLSIVALFAVNGRAAARYAQKRATGAALPGWRHIV